VKKERLEANSNRNGNGKSGRIGLEESKSREECRRGEKICENQRKEGLRKLTLALAGIGDDRVFDSWLESTREKGGHSITSKTMATVCRRV
jgi:hypothetical protein